VKRAALALLVVLLASCSDIESGQIMEKKFYDEYVTLMPIYTYDAKGQISGMYLQEIYTPPCWQFFLRDGDKTGSPCVDARDYMVYEGGQWYP
jgi:hypothetical protein